METSTGTVEKVSEFSIEAENIYQADDLNSVPKSLGLVDSLSIILAVVALLILLLAVIRMKQVALFEGLSTFYFLLI